MENIKANFETSQEHADDLVDEALEETFPASDPISPALPRNRSEAINDVNKNVAPETPLYKKVLQHKALVFSAVLLATWGSLLIRRKLNDQH